MINARTNLPQGTEPSDEEVQQYMRANNIDFYNARENLREAAYGGKPPGGFQSWGDFWKSV